MEDAARSKSALALVETKRPSLVPPMWESAVRTVGVAESKQAGLALAHAFAADELSQFLVNTDDATNDSAEQKWALHVNIMTHLTAAHAYSGAVTTIGPDYDAVALWMPPGKEMDGWWPRLCSGMWRLYFLLTPQGKGRFYDDLMPLLHHTKKEIMGKRDTDCYYLVYIGTKPHARCKGYATKLIEDMSVRADAEDRAMYLESSSEANNAFYSKFGFAVKKDISLCDGSGTPVTMSIMVREPRPEQEAYSATINVNVRTGELRKGTLLI